MKPLRKLFDKIVWPALQMLTILLVASCALAYGLFQGLSTSGPQALAALCLFAIGAFSPMYIAVWIVVLLLVSITRSWGRLKKVLGLYQFLSALAFALLAGVLIGAAILKKNGPPSL